MKAALCQMSISFEDKAASLYNAKMHIKKAAENKADIIVFPEMTLTGFSMDISKTKENGDTKQIFAELAKTHNIAIGFGWVKDCGAKAQNMYTVVDRDGKELAEYAKIHPFSYAGEDKYFIGGKKQVFFTLDNLTIGLAVCYDLRFSQLFAIKTDYDLMLVPANWPAARSEHWSALLKARAIENQAYFAGINCTGLMDDKLYTGDSAVFAPDGSEAISLHNTEGLLIVDIDKEAVNKTRAAFPVRQDRRYDIYTGSYTE